MFIGENVLIQRIFKHTSFDYSLFIKLIFLCSFLIRYFWKVSPHFYWIFASYTKDYNFILTPWSPTSSENYTLQFGALRMETPFIYDSTSTTFFQIVLFCGQKWWFLSSHFFIAKINTRLDSDSFRIALIQIHYDMMIKYKVTLTKIKTTHEVDNNTKHPVLIDISGNCVFCMFDYTNRHCTDKYNNNSIEVISEFSIRFW